MAMNTTVGDDGTPEGILGVAERHFDRVVNEVEGVITELKGGDQKAAKEAASIMRDLNKAMQTAFDERAKVAKLRKQTDGIVHDYALDFDSARDEIGRRMARLRVAADTGKIPE